MVFVCSNVQWCTIVCVHHLIYDARHHSGLGWMADFLALPPRHFALFFPPMVGKGRSPKVGIVCSVWDSEMHRPSDGCIRSVHNCRCDCGHESFVRIVPVCMCADFSDWFVSWKYQECFLSVFVFNYWCTKFLFMSNVKWNIVKSILYIWRLLYMSMML